MKTAIKREYNEFLFISLKLISGLTVIVNRPGTPKLWAIAHKMAIKGEYGEFLAISLKLVSGIMVIVNRPGIPKLWVIAHENGHKTRKRQVFGHISQTCIGSYYCCKSP